VNQQPLHYQIGWADFHCKYKMRKDGQEVIRLISKHLHYLH